MAARELVSVLPTNLGKGGPNYLTFLYLLVALFSSAYYTLQGSSTGDTALFATGLAFIGALMGAFVLNFFLDGGLFYSEASIFQEAMALWLGRSTILALGGFGGVQFSFLSAPSEAGHILSSFVGATGPSVRAAVNVFQAPGVENAAIIPLGILFFIIAGLVLVRLGVQAFPIQIGIAAAIPAVVFIGLHGPRTLGFQILAGSVMVFWVAWLFLADKGVLRLPMLGPIGVAILSAMYTIGLHSGINILSTGGLFAYYGALWNAAADVAFAADMILGFEALTIILAVIGFVDVANRGL